MISFIKKHRNYLFSLSTIILLICCVISLSIINYNLNEKLASKSSFLKNGEELKPIITLTDTNSMEITKFERKNIVLVNFSTNCPYCEASSPFWQKLHNEFGESFKFLGISNSSITNLEQYKNKMGLKFEFLRTTNQDLIRNKLVKVPQILFIREGKVEKLWAGLLDEKRFQEIKLTLTNYF